MLLEFQIALPPNAFRIQVQETPLSVGISRCHPWYGYQHLTATQGLYPKDNKINTNKYKI